MIERRILDIEDAEDRIERTTLALVREFDAINVVGSSAHRFGDIENLFCGDVNEFRAWIDEAPDQPRAGDTIDLRMLSCDPLGRRAKISAGWQTSLVPGGDAAFEIGGSASEGTQVRDDGLTPLLPMHAVTRYRMIRRQVSRPASHIIRRAMARANDQALVAGEIRCAANIHQHGG